MRENFVQSMTMQVKAQIYEESKLWSTSWPFAKPIRDAMKKIRERNPTISSFAWLCEISHTMRNQLMQPRILHTMPNFAWYAKSSCAPTPLDFLSSYILCNFLVSPCNQPRYFLLYFFIYLLGSLYIRRKTEEWIMDVFH